MRNRTLALLKSGKLPVIVCDNLGARGLDTMGVSHVIQFEFAKSPQDYLQRVGRTGRLGQPGKVINFIRDKDLDLWNKISLLVRKGSSLESIFRKPIRRKIPNVSREQDDVSINR